ncbi:MAG: HAD-IC family P-type ATPase [Hyphomicrobiaceae bacterium]|nr:HAD-IC family P-type ATPase [Hyphomicrobiaceae bacterium]
MQDENSRAIRWHTSDTADALSALESSPSGLTSEEAGRRLERYGANALPAARARSIWRRLLEQIDNVLIYVLLASAVVTAFLGHVTDTAVIVGVVVLNALIGFIQEGRAEAALDAIRGMISPRAAVIRDGHRIAIDASAIVPGDILVIEPGDRIGADVRILTARNLKIDEAILTGESVPVLKSVKSVGDAASLGDRRSMGYSGTLVTAGQGTGLVVATGIDTELGRISALMQRVEQLETPLLRQMNIFARQLTAAILALSAVTFAFAVLVRSYPADYAFMAVVGMAVAAIPEGLPAVMSITLAIGVTRMASRHAIIRRLPAVETLGSVSTICTDKTGTLTRNEMTVTRCVAARRVFDIDGVGYEPRGRVSSAGEDIGGDTAATALDRIALTSLLCNDARLREVDGAWVILGDPMEGALLTFAAKLGYNRRTLEAAMPRVDVTPFDAAHRYMATLHMVENDAPLILVKGAPEAVIGMCATEAAHTCAHPIDADFWHAAVDAMARDGRRVLALASASCAPGTCDLDPAHLRGRLQLDGLVGLIDPPRQEAVAAVAECLGAGISVKMITGDHAATAAAIAASLGLPNPHVVQTGADLDKLDEAAFAATVAEANVFARTSPEHKLKLVQALQAQGSVVAMTGDGVNDAPALKRADVGVAMGKNGTEAAKEAADMVLADDNFASIVAAVREGRTVYDNLTKVIGWTLPTNGGETLLVVTAILLGVTLPMTPLQMLWINMITAVGLGLILAFEPAEDGIMQRTPRRTDEPILSGFLLWRVIFVSVLFCAGVFAVFHWSLSRGMDVAGARTMVVNTVVVMEIFYLFSIRYLHGASLTWQGIVGTRAVLIGVGSIVLLQLAFTYLPMFQRLFDTRPVAIDDGVAVIACGILLLLILEIEKWLRAIWFPAPPRPRDAGHGQSLHTPE